MSTVGKAITLLEAFSIGHPQLGLTELARFAGFDKATTRRLLVSLAAHGLIEQDASSRLYRLGPALVRLAHIREANFPFLESAKPHVVALAQETGETVHLSEFDSHFLTSSHVEESREANRISLAVGDRLPLNATASGLAYLAFARPEYVETYLARPMERFTQFTPVEPLVLRQKLNEARARGYSIGDQGHSEGVFSVAAPILDRDGYAIGAVAVASPLVRIDEHAVERHGQAAIVAARNISARLNGRMPAHFQSTTSPKARAT
ncbi:MAG: IclR family transcriptional regulator [Devosia sp.]